MAQWLKGRHSGTAWWWDEDVSSRMFDVTICNHILLGHMDRTMTIVCCGLLFFKKKKTAAPIDLFFFGQQKLRLNGTFAACLLLKAQRTSYWRSYTFWTYVQNQTPRKNKKVVTINSLQLVILKIPLYALSSWCASAIAGFPHPKNNITVCLHVKHNNGATLPWLGAIVKQISLLYIITSLSKQAATQSSLIFLKFNWNLTVLQTLRTL